MRKSGALAYMAGRLGATEINATFYRTQTPQTFRAWHDAVPEGFVFAVKAARGAAQRREAAEAAPAIERFLHSGLAELGDKLGPLLWQLPAGRVFDADAFSRFLDLLPDTLDGLPLRHAIEAAHPSFDAAEALLGERSIARVILDKPGVAPADRPTAPHVYLRLQGTHSEIETGYDAPALDAWAVRLRDLARPAGRRVHTFVIAGAKERNPAAALALQSRIAA